MEIPTKPEKPANPKNPNDPNASKWAKYNNYVKFCDEVTAYNRSNNTDAKADVIWKKAAKDSDAYAALKKVQPIKPTEPKGESTSKPDRV